MKCPLCRQPLSRAGGDWLCPSHGSVPPASYAAFISYGRADGAVFAARLADDLERRGYPVWIDRTGIGAGAAWDVRIEEGIRGAEVLLAVMTPHSLRGASVCRNEILFALNEGKRVVPLRVAADPEVKPTLLLAGRNWIDFSAGYEQGLGDLLRFLDGDEAALRPPEHFGIAGVVPLDFEVEKARYAAGFTGRAWVARELDGWLAGPRRALVIVGEPGLGKSALAAWLDRQRPEAAALHFCTQRNTRSLNPHVFVASLVQQLYRRLPGYAGAVEGRLPEARRPTAGDAFRELVVEPARRLPTPPRPRLLLVDALDEAVGGTEETVADVLVEQAADLPPWLRIVATTRPETAVLDRVRALGTLELQANRPENRQDVGAFVRSRLSAPPLAGRLAGAAEAVAERVEALAEGNFLYARLTLEALEEGSLSVADVGRLAAGLSHFYAASFRRRFPHLPAYATAYAPLLRALAVARGPLPFGLLLRLAGQGEEVLRRRLRELRGYLRVEGTGPSAGYALFHKSLQEWLTDADAAGDYWCDQATGHAQLADALWAERHTAGYALRHLPAHLAAARRWDGLADLLLEPAFLEAKVEAGLVFDLAGDFADAVAGLPPGHRSRGLLQLLEEALRRDIHFLARHPAALLQCLWNSAWWLDCPQAAEHYDPPEGGWPDDGPPWARPGPRLSALLETWRSARDRATPGFRWLRSLRPPAHPLGTAQRAILRGHEGSVYAVIVSPDGRRIASASKDGTVRLWDAASGAEVLCLRGHRGWVLSVAFSQDGRRLFTGSVDRTVRVWDAAGGVELACLQGHGERVWDVAVSPDGSQVMSGSDDWTVRFWDLASRREARHCRLRGLSEQGAALWVAFAPDGRRAIAGLGDGTVLVWDLAGAAGLRRLAGHAGAICGVAFSPDGRRLATAGAEGSGCLWDTSDWAQLACLQPAPDQQASTSGLAFSPDGRRLAWGSADRTVRIWDVDRRSEVACLRGHERGVTDVAFSPDGSWLVSGSADATVRIWKAAGGTAPPRLRGHRELIRALAFAPDGRCLASGGDDRTVRVWSASTGAQVACHSNDEAAIRSLAFAPDGRRLAFGAEDGTVWVWDFPDRPPIACRPGHLGAVLCLAFSADGRRLASGSWDGEIHLRDAGSDGPPVRLVGHGDRVWRIAFSGDGTQVLSAAADGTCRTWDATTGTCQRVGPATEDAGMRPRAGWGAVARGLETVIEAPEGGAVAWLPEAAGLILKHPSECLWAGAAGAHLHLFRLEGEAHAL